MYILPPRSVICIYYFKHSLFITIMWSKPDWTRLKPYEALTNALTYTYIQSRIQAKAVMTIENRKNYTILLNMSLIDCAHLVGIFPHFWLAEYDVWFVNYFPSNSLRWTSENITVVNFWGFFFFLLLLLLLFNHRCCNEQAGGYF